MNQLFLISFIMSLVILPLLIHRKFRGVKFSSKVYYVIWIIIAIRLVLPFDISMENSIYKFSSPIEEYEKSNYNLQETQVEVNLPSKENIQYEDSGTNFNGTKKLNFISTLRDNLFNIWLAGAILYFVYNSFFYLLFKYRVKKSLSFVSKDIEEKFNDIKAYMVPESKVIVRESHIIDSPMIIGIAKPILLVPENINIKNIDYIFAHELVHLKRKDLVYKLIVFLATSIHWFNPVIHLMGKIANEDIELSCDEEVTVNMVREDKIEYSKTLIETISNRKKAPILTTSYSGGKEMIKRRLDKILDNIRKKSGKPLIISLILVILCTSFLIGCETKEENTWADELYSYKTKYVGDNSKVGGIVSKLEFSKECSYKSMEILSKEKPYGLKLYFNGNANEANIDDFKFDSAILFSLIDNLDHVIYIVEEDGAEIEIGTITRAYVDSITTSVLGRKTSELGSSKNKFTKLVGFYEEVKSEIEEGKKDISQIVEDKLNTEGTVKIEDDSQVFTDKYEDLVYKAHYPTEYKKEEDSFTAIALDVKGVYEKDNILKIYAVVRKSEVLLYNDGKVIDDSGYLMPTVSIYEKSGDAYELIEVIQPRDGSEYKPSIKEMCKDKPLMANKLMNIDYEKINEEIKNNVVAILKRNGYNDVNMEEFH